MYSKTLDSSRHDVVSYSLERFFPFYFGISLLSLSFSGVCNLVDLTAPNKLHNPNAPQTAKARSNLNAMNSLLEAFIKKLIYLSNPFLSVRG